VTDIVDKTTRSRMMAGIRGKDTKPELAIRKALHAMGFRFRLHRKDLPGRPDIVLPKYQLVIFVHGCFWHRHPGCSFAATPATRPKFWKAKLEGNRRRDVEKQKALRDQGWRVFTVWECGIRHDPEDLMRQLAVTIQNAKVFEADFPSTPPLPKQK